MIENFSNFIIPLMVLCILIHGIYKKVNVYDVFVEGAKESFDTVLSIFPSLLGMILGINIFLKSNVLEYILKFLSPILSNFKISFEIIYLAIMRPISGSSSLAILNSIYEKFGPDGFMGTLASVIQGSTDTTLYVLTLYFGSIGIKKIKYALWVGLVTDLIGVIVSLVVVNLLFN